MTTMPVVKTPFHMSYLIYLSRFSRSFMRRYLSAALSLCRRAGVNPSFLLHPLDVLGPEDASELAFFPGMDLPAKHKRAIVSEILGTLGEQFTLVPMSSHATTVLARKRLAVVEPRAQQLAASG